MSCVSSDFHLKGPSLVQFYGIGGRTLTKLRQFDLSLVAQFNPTILLLEIGSSDLGNPRLEATDLATNIFRLAQKLHFSYRVSHIIVSQILPRRSPPQIFSPYNTKVKQLNPSLHDLFKATLFATFWFHPCILHLCARIFLCDGIHLNFAGNPHNSIIPNPQPVFVLRPKCRPHPRRHRRPTTGPVTTSPLAVYHLPCNVSFVGMVTGIGTCPDHISISVPLSMASSLQFVPWTAAATNTSRLITTFVFLLR